jgi:phenylacetyl-CoA:acceptor oxidoreductase subunit 2
VSQLVREQPAFQLNAAAGTDPQIKYLYTTPAVPGRDSVRADDDEERLADPANPLVGPRQTFWDWRAAMNWIFGGIGSGLAITAWLAYALGAIDSGRAAFLLFASAVLVATGLTCVFFKIGRKLRFWRAATRFQSSWMARELYAALVYFPAVLWSFLAPAPASFGLAALGAAAFLACQAKILHRARGIPAWRAPLVPWMIFATGLAEGAGAFAILGAPRSVAAYAIAALLIAVNFALWRSYAGSARAEGIPPLSRRAIHAMSLPLHVVGHALPLALLAAAWLAPAAATILLPFAGLGMIAGGVLWKYGLVVKASYYQGFDLPRVPQRGSGTRAAPARLDLAAMARRPA